MAMVRLISAGDWMKGSMTDRTGEIKRPDVQKFWMRSLMGTRTFLKAEEKAVLDRAFILGRAIAFILYNFAQSGHPGGSTSVMRQWIAEMLTGQMAFDIAAPWDKDADRSVQAAGHKAMGWYAFLAMMNEAVRQARPDLLSDANGNNMRLEDLLGFRRNASDPTPLRTQFGSRNLDGHPTPETPFTDLATGASGVGDGTGFGLALGLKRMDPSKSSVVFVNEGEGGMTPGRVEEAMQIAARSGLDNLIYVIDYNNASIDIANVTAEGGYAMPDPAERTFLHGFHTIEVDGKDFEQLAAAIDYAKAYLVGHGKPIAIVCRTEKGEGYGFGTNKSHGGGHKMNDAGYFAAQEVFEKTFGVTLPREGDLKTAAGKEQMFWQSLLAVREALQKDPELAGFIADRVAESKAALEERKAGRTGLVLPDVRPLIEFVAEKPVSADAPPQSLVFKPGDSIALRTSLGRALKAMHEATGGAFLASAADLYGSLALDQFAPYDPMGPENPLGTALATGITEDATSAMMVGFSTSGVGIGVTGTYGAFGQMYYTAGRLHAIGFDAIHRERGNPVIFIAGHAGPPTGEDGPTHACPQSLTTWSNFPGGLAITLTPGTNEEMWPAMVAAFRQRPAVIVPFVTRPNITVADRAALGLTSPVLATQGVYHIKPADLSAPTDAHVVVQGSGVMNELLANGGEAMKAVAAAGLNVDYVYVVSPQLYDALPAASRRAVWNGDMASRAMGVTDFTLADMHRWIRSDEGIDATLYPHKGGHFLGSGVGSVVLRQGGLGAEQIAQAVIAFAQQLRTRVA